MGAMASQITSLKFVYSIVYSGTGDRRIPPHKWPVTGKMFPFDDVIMTFLHMPQEQCSGYILHRISGILVKGWFLDALSSLKYNGKTVSEIDKTVYSQRWTDNHAWYVKFFICIYEL